jgi:DNA polymerase/3'-5' exonuclease PolX
MADHNDPIPLSDAQDCAQMILQLLKGCCKKIAVAGSIRREKQFVNDIEILCVPKKEKTIIDIPPIQNKKNDDQTLFDMDGITAKNVITKKDVVVDLLQERIINLIEGGILSKRKKINGTTTFGEKTKLLVDVESNLPVDIFSCEEEDWYNCMVSRTGGLKTNIEIASLAKKYGMRWLAFGPGFLKKNGEIINISKEEDVFEIVGLPYRAPNQRK